MTSPPAVEQPVHRCGALLEYLARRLRLRSESVLAPLGLRPRHLVALTVLRARGGSTQQALASTLEMDGTNVVGLLNDLEAEKLIERRRSPEDRRRHIVELTEAGVERLASAECALAAVEDEVLGVLGHDQRETLYGLLQQVATGGVEAACVEADTGGAGAAACDGVPLC
ncbi:MarR family winged helix-turn-helix transcriptional regulator [Microbispora rosea]|uniref:MarR family winged helix-turn-helix transcriptional regulator n=1 Tax=Microbispora rosea TaxID=58117 RepID=UPI003D8A2A5D